MLKKENSSNKKKYERCNICGLQVECDFFDYHKKTEEHIIDLILEYFPSWIMDDGSSPKAIEFFRKIVLPSKSSIKFPEEIEDYIP